MLKLFALLVIYLFSLLIAVILLLSGETTSCLVKRPANEVAFKENVQS